LLNTALKIQSGIGPIYYFAVLISSAPMKKLDVFGDILSFGRREQFPKKNVISEEEYQTKWKLDEKKMEVFPSKWWKIFSSGKRIS
jgi:hypothetical protein